MKCKYCGRSGVPDGSSYCNWCGKQIVRTRGAKKKEVKVPDPKPLANGGYYIKFQLDGAYQYVSAATQQECTAQAIAVKAGIIDSRKPLRLTLGRLLDEYIASNQHLSPSTLRGYQAIRRTRFQRYMNTPIDSVKNWQTVINQEAELCSAKTLKNAWGLVVAAMKAKEHPVPNVKLPKQTRPDKKFFTPEQITIFVDAVKDRSICIPALLGLHSLRRSEIMDLTWDDVDLDAGTIRVEGAAVIGTDGKLVHKQENKTDASRRIIRIMIPELRTALAQAPHTSDHIVTCNPNTLYKQINRVCEENDLPLVGVHGLRHSFASLAYHLQIPAEITCLMGGWSDRKTVLDIYTHLYDEDILQQGNKMVDFYSEKDPSPEGLIFSA